MRHFLALGTIALTLAACSPNQKASSAPTSTKPSIQEVFKSSETLNGTALKYPAGKPELRLYRVEIPAGGKIPLHTHPAPMTVYVPGMRSEGGIQSITSAVNIPPDEAVKLAAETVFKEYRDSARFDDDASDLIETWGLKPG